MRQLRQLDNIIDISRRRSVGTLWLGNLVLKIIIGYGLKWSPYKFKFKKQVRNGVLKFHKIVGISFIKDACGKQYQSL